MEVFGEGFIVAIPLRGYAVCNSYSGGLPRLTLQLVSQSPYGAMWFATSGLRLALPWGQNSGRNPLTGLSGLQRLPPIRLPPPGQGSQSPYGAKWFATERGSAGAGVDARSQSPYGAKWFATEGQPGGVVAPHGGSQSPYGAKWFATRQHTTPIATPHDACRNPLTGLSGLQP